MLLDYREACAKSHGKTYILMGDDTMRLVPWSLMLGSFLATEALHLLLGFGVPTVSEAPDGVLIGCGEQDRSLDLSSLGLHEHLGVIRHGLSWSPVEG